LQHQLGCGHRRSATLSQGENWANGFLIVHCDSHRKKSVFNYVQITDFAVVCGKRYFREDNEIVTPH
jgi:hypothetical protein